MNITDKAIAKLKSMQEEGKLLRVEVQGGGCSGFIRSMGWIMPSEVTDKDKVTDMGGLQVAIDSKSNLFLASTTLDYSDDLNSPGWKWENLAATKSCGCGSSFAV